MLLNDIKKIIEDNSPYDIEDIKFSTIGENSELMNIVDVYTKSNIKNNDKIFKAEGDVLKDLPNNYFVRYF